MMNAEGTNVLVIDDEYQIRRLLRMTLEDIGYSVSEAETGETGLNQIICCRPGVVILDLGLPGKSGLETLRDLRRWSDVPVLVLSIFSQEKSKVEALDAGADDYLTKPFGTAELLARMRALQRRMKSAVTTNVFRFGDVEVDLPNRLVLKKEHQVKLTTVEFALLELFISNRGKVLTHRHILSALWGVRSVSKTHYLRTYMLRLRRKLEDNPQSPKYFQSDSGVGYRFYDDDLQAVR